VLELTPRHVNADRQTSEEIAIEKNKETTRAKIKYDDLTQCMAYVYKRQ